MSELNENVEVEIDDATVVTVPLVDNLTATNAAPIAKTVGDALDAKLDTADVMEHVTITFDGVESDNQGVLLVSGDDIPVEDGSTTMISDALDALDAKTAADIKYTALGNESIKAKVDEIASSVSTIQGSMYGDDIPIDDTSGAESIKSVVDTAVATIASAVKITSQTFTDSEKIQARTNIGAASTGDVVLVNSSQSLNTTQQAQARANIAAIGTGEAVLIGEQTLTDGQKTQARANIGAAPSGDLSTVITLLGDLFRIETYTAEISCAATSIKNISRTELNYSDIEGYTPVCITNMTLLSFFNLYKVDLQAETNILSVRSFRTSDSPDVSISVSVLWVKNGVF